MYLYMPLTYLPLKTLVFIHKDLNIESKSICLIFTIFVFNFFWYKHILSVFILYSLYVCFLSLKQKSTSTVNK